MSRKRAAKEHHVANRDKRPRFPEATQLAEIFDSPSSSSGLMVRNNTEYLSKMSKTTLFIRPTQLGKSTLFALAEMVYSKRKTAPRNIATTIPSKERNAGYVIRFDFLHVDAFQTGDDWQKDLVRIDSTLFHYIKRRVLDFLILNEELQPFFCEPPGEALAGAYLRSLSHAVTMYTKTSHQKDVFFMVLVDEYDKPLRETLFGLLNQSEQVNVTRCCPHYSSFFTACQSVGQDLPYNKVWVTGIVPIALDIMSDFTPTNGTFQSELLDAVGLGDKDVDRMLLCVHEAQPFANENEKQRIRQAIRDHANQLRFLTGSPLYHTRMVNELMQTVLHPEERTAWLRDLTRKPPGVDCERAPSAVYELLDKSLTCREIAKDLVANKDIHGFLNMDLNLPDVANANISKDNYLTLLVHLGVASVQHDPSGSAGHVFRPTSRYFRSEYLNALFRVTLWPLFECNTVDEIYDNRALVQEFIQSLPANGMAKMIAWAKQSSQNRTLQLQSQGCILGDLHDHFVTDNADIQPKHEDVLGANDRTDIQIKGNSTVLILELKQLPGLIAPPAKTEMEKYHRQLHGYVESVSKKRTKPLLVAGFVMIDQPVPVCYLISILVQASAIHLCGV